MAFSFLLLSSDSNTKKKLKYRPNNCPNISISTVRNGPLQEFLREMLGAAPTGVVNLMRRDFDARCPRLVHSTKEIVLNG